jgi:RNA polymerase sigma factor (sigma-70 family)
VNRTNRQLFEEVKLGHDWAWKVLVARYEKLVMSIAMRCGLSNVDAEDCAQLSWIALYKNLESIRDPDRLGAWLTITTRRNAARIAKRLAIRDEYLEGDDAAESKLLLSDQEAARLEQHVHLEYAIDQLDNRCKRLIRELFYSPKGDSYREISDRLGISENSVGPIRYRCLEKLRRILEECGFL